MAKKVVKVNVKSLKVTSNKKAAPIKNQDRYEGYRRIATDRKK